MTSVCFQGKPFNITVIQIYAIITDVKEAEVEPLYEDLHNLLQLSEKNKRKKKKLFFIIWDWNTKVRNQEIPGVTDKFGLENKMKQSK